MLFDKTLLQAEQDWPSVAKVLYVPHDESEYSRLVGSLGQLIDQVSGDEAHPLASLMEVIAVLIENYADEPMPELDSDG